MTREVKLSLILSFAFVLVVGVLLSDHFSRAARTSDSGPDAMAGLPRQSEGVASAVPDLVLMDESGRASRPQPKTQPAPEPVQIQPASADAQPVDPGVIAGINATDEPVARESDTLIENLRRRMAESMTTAIDDISTGQVPEAAVSLSDDRQLSYEEQEEIASQDPLVAEPAILENQALAASKPSNFRTYSVKQGDTLWSIASRELGDGRLHKSIRELNADRLGPDGQLRAGASIKLPIAAGTSGTKTASKEQARKPEAPEKQAKIVKASSKRTYEVKQGDTLSKIAARMLGSASKASEIIDANSDTLTDEDSLDVGMILTIPAR
jgi:nucleoid-associated protein YgaU